ncbi:MAG: DUF1990 family protein [Bacteroidota bacterium]|nr:DUF1990 family protein [Bacteroidota bacterium]
MKYDIKTLREKISIIELSTKTSLENLDLKFFFDYHIFPNNIIAFLAQWNDENRNMQVGDTIVQQAFIPPIRMFSQKIIFGVRIHEIIDQKDKKGYSYETLEGHVEKGISTFTIEQYGEKLIFKIQTFSKPGNILPILLGPIFSVPYQTFCTKAALRNVKRRIENEQFF